MIIVTFVIFRERKKMTEQPVFGLDFTTIVKAGPGCRSLVPKTFTDLGCKRVAMITDKGLIEAGVVEMVREAFDAQGVELAGIFDSVRQDNDTRDINECARWYREIGADGILAVGGGSVLDTAKCIKVMLGLDTEDINELIKGGIVYYMRPKAKPIGIPHISIPTTAGTGAEVSQGAALMDGAANKKIIMFHQHMNSDYAFLDPELTISLPPKLTAEPAFDSLSHCCEAFFTTNPNSFADALALRAARLIVDNLPIAVKDGKNIEARGELQVAASMACVATVASGLGANPIHNFADSVGPVYRLTHGLANAVYLPIVMKNLPSHYLRRIKPFAEVLGIPIDSKDDAQLLDEVIARFVLLQEECGIPPRLDIEVDQNQLEELRTEVKEDPAGINFPLPDDVINACLEDSLTIK